MSIEIIGIPEVELYRIVTVLQALGVKCCRTFSIVPLCHVTVRWYRFNELQMIEEPRSATEVVQPK